MSYSSIVEMSQSASLMMRITAAAAAEGVESPQSWVTQRIWTFATQPGWDEAWDYAKGTYNLDFNPDTGARPGVINDTMILAAVQALKPAVSGATDM